MNRLNNNMFKDMDFEYLNNIADNTSNKETLVCKKKDTIYTYKKTYVLKKGRAREKQLKNMTKIERELEKKFIKEKNRLSAKKYRTNKKKYINMLKTKVELYETQIVQQQKEINILKLQIDTLNKKNYKEHSLILDF